MGPIEREHPRLDRRERDAAIDAGEPLREPERLFALDRDEEPTLARFQRELDALGDAAFDAFFVDDAVDDDIEVVRFAAVERDLVAEVDDGAVDAGADEAFPAHAFELELQLPLSRARDRREHAEASALGHRQDAVDDLLHRLRLDALATVGAVRDADAREQEAQVVGDLGDGADRGAR